MQIKEVTVIGGNKNIIFTVGGKIEGTFTVISKIETGVSSGTEKIFVYIEDKIKFIINKCSTIIEYF